MGQSHDYAIFGYDISPLVNIIYLEQHNGGQYLDDKRTTRPRADSTWCCTRQDDALGPRAVLDTVLAQRNLARSLLPDCPAALRPRLLSTLSNATRKAGWLSFDLNDFTGAAYVYEDARALAHEAENVELSAHVLRNMRYLAIWRLCTAVTQDSRPVKDPQCGDDQRGPLQRVCAIR